MKKSVTAKAKSYGYSDKYAKDIGRAQEAYKKGQKPVKKSTNKPQKHLSALKKGRS